MSRTALYRLAATICLIVMVASANAQPASILFDHYTTADGLSNNAIWKICKTRNGYLWLGTQDGLCRFDGRNFKTYRYDLKDSNSLSNNTVYELMEDADGYLWIGTFSGFNRYNPANNSITRIKPGKYLRDKNINVGVGAVAQAPGARTRWVGSQGIYYVNMKNNTLEKAPGVLNDSVFKTDGNIKTLLAERDNRIWIGGNTGLILYNGATGQYELFHTPQKKLLSGEWDYYINKLLLDKSGTLWVATWGLGLLEFDTAQKKFVNQYLPEVNVQFNATTNIVYNIEKTDFPGQENIIWMACGSGSLLAFNTQTKTFSSYKSDKPESKKGIYAGVFSLLFDDAEGLWIGSGKGLYRYDLRLQVFAEHSFEYNLKKNCLSYVFDAYTDPLDVTGNTLWLGTWNCGLFKYNLELQELSTVPDWMGRQMKTRVGYHPVLRAKNNILWIGSTSDGLLAADEKNKTVQRFYPVGKDKAPVKTIQHIQEDNLGNLWVGTFGGIYCFDTKELVFKDIRWNIPGEIQNKLSTNVTGICFDKEGNTWFTAQNNYNEEMPVVGKIQKGSFTASGFYHNPNDKNSLPDVKTVTNLVCDDSNRIWCASWNGLISFNASEKNPRFQLYTTEDGLLNNFINKVAIDAAGNIWCATINGLSVYLVKDKKFRSFSNAGMERDNVSDIFYNKQQQRLMIGEWGKIYSLHTNEVARQTAPPKVVITDLRVFNQAAPEVKKMLFDGSRISLAHDRNVVTIDYAALSFHNPAQVKYAYKMEGIDKDWIYTSNNSISYHLGSGNYVFRVKAMNAEGVWNEKGSHMEIIIATPFWRKSWFLFLVVLTATSLLYSIYKYRINQLKKMQDMRNNISRNLHDDIGASLSNINILNELAKRNMNEPLRAGEYLSKAGEDIQRISESLSDIVWNINPRYDDLQNLFIRMKRYAADMMDGRQITYEINFPEEIHQLSLSMDKRRELYLIFKEAINNLVKYSKAKNVKIELWSEGHRIIMSVTDDGIGFDSNTQQYGNGITNMRQRAANCGAQLQISSQPGKGTSVHLEIQTV